MAITKLIRTPSLTKPSSQEIRKSPSAAPTKRVRPQVSFDESFNTVHVNTTWTAEDCARFWYSEYQFRSMKEANTAQAKQIHKKESKTDDVTYTSVMERIYDVCSKAEIEDIDQVLSNKQKAVLTKYVGRANSRTGLERIFCRDIAHDKKFRRETITEAVLAAQAAGASADLICLHSQTVSRPSRHYATVMATALATALQQEQA